MDGARLTSLAASGLPLQAFFSPSTYSAVHPFFSSTQLFFLLVGSLRLLFFFFVVFPTSALVRTTFAWFHLVLPGFDYLLAIV